MGLCGACLLTWLVDVSLVTSQSTTIPDPATSHIVPSQSKRGIVYITPWESFLLIWAWLAGLGFAIVGNTIEDKNWWRKIATRRNQRPPSN
jgi:hypothetical protein